MNVLNVVVSTGRSGRVQPDEEHQEGTWARVPAAGYLLSNSSSRIFFSFMSLHHQSSDYQVKKRRCKYLKSKLNHIKKTVSDYDRRA